jgi:hypothetical protein
MEASSAKALQQKVGYFCTSQQVFLYQQGNSVRASNSVRAWRVQFIFFLTNRTNFATVEGGIVTITYRQIDR